MLQWEYTMLHWEYTMLHASYWQCQREWAAPSSQCPKPAKPDTSPPFLGCPSFHTTSHTLTLAFYTCLWTLERRSRSKGLTPRPLSWLPVIPPYLSHSYTCFLHLPFTLASGLWKGGAGVRVCHLSPLACHSPSSLSPTLFTLTLASCKLWAAGAGEGV